MNQQFKNALEKLGLNFELIKFNESTHTAAQAAEQLKCDIAQIAKSIVMKTKDSNKSVLVITSGRNRVDVKKIEALVGEEIEKADADFVEEQTGYIVGGVAPIGHKNNPITFLDEDLREFKIIYAAAGRSDSVFELTPNILKEITKAEFRDIKESN